MPVHIEPLSNGLVTARDAGVLEPGELAVANDVMLKPGSTSLHKAPGRATFGTLTAATGIAYADFETASDKLVAVDGGSYKTATAGLTGTFSTLTTGAGSTLEAVVTEDRAVLLSGPVEENLVLLNNGTSRPHGLQPIITTPGALHISTGGTWTLGATQLGWFEYWTTEVHKVGEGEANDQEEVESTFAGTPATVEITATTSHVVITAPNIVNSNATHWRVYRSEKKTNQFNQAFPVGWLISDDIIISQRSFEDGLSTVTAAKPPTGATSPTTPQFTYGPITTTAAAWGTPTDVLTDNGVFAISAGCLYASPGANTQTISQLLLNTFGLLGVTAPVTNINVQVEGSRTVGGMLIAYLSWDGGTSWTNGKQIPVGTSNATVSIDGGDWGRSWADTEFSDTNFKVLLIAFGSHASIAATISIDIVRVTVSYNSTTAGLVTQFPNIILRIANEDVPVGSNGHPAAASTGDIFQACLITNDVNDPTAVVWTIPGTIDYMPVLYRLIVGETVKSIRTVGSTCVVGCIGRKIRLNFLPVAEDPEFNTGRCAETIDPDDGVVSHDGMVAFTLNGQPTLFCVGNNSLKITNGYTIDNATNDIIWTDTANTAALSTAFVVNNALHHEILVYYPAPGSSTPNKVLRLSYHPTHLKNGKLKVAGITNFSARAATTGIASTGERRLHTMTPTTVYVENQGYADSSSTGIVPQFATREMHLAELGNSWEMTNAGLHHQGGDTEVDFWSTAALANYPAESTSAKKIALTARMLSLVDNANSGDGITLHVLGRNDGKGLVADYLAVFAEGLGETTPLKQ